MISRAQQILREDWSAHIGLRSTELGIEQLCRCCDEWWPRDGEFFSYISTRRTYHAICNACRAENERNSRLRKNDPILRIEASS